MPAAEESPCAYPYTCVGLPPSSQPQTILSTMTNRCINASESTTERKAQLLQCMKNANFSLLIPALGGADKKKRGYRGRFPLKTHNFGSGYPSRGTEIYLVKGLPIATHLN